MPDGEAHAPQAFRFSAMQRATMRGMGDQCEWSLRKVNPEDMAKLLANHDITKARSAPACSPSVG